MKRTGIIALLLIVFSITNAQANENDSLVAGTVQVILKDIRINMMGKKMAEYNEAAVSRVGGYKMVRGYRLMLLSTSDRSMAMSIRSKLLQQYPEQKVYMTFQSPYIKLKFGNFAEKSEAERYRKQVAAMGIISNNIYLVPEMIEIKVEKTVLTED